METHDQVKQYVDIAWRRKWWVVAPALLGLAASFYLARALPKEYRASTTILTIRQSVPPDIAKSTVTMLPEERMKSLKVQVLSRRYVEKVAREYGLVKPGDDEATVERVCRKLASGPISITWDRQGYSWFKIIVDDGDPKRAAQMANRLAELFIDQSASLREQQAQGNVEMVSSWRKSAEAELAERDRKIAQFRKEHMYELPDQQAPTLQLLNASQARIDQLTSEIQMRRQRLETLRAEEVARRSAAATGAPAPVTGDPDSAALARMQSELQNLLTNYTDANPVVKRKREQIAQFKALHPNLRSEIPSDDSGDAVSTPEIARVEGEVTSLVADREREQKQFSELQRRIEEMPKIQEQLAELTRDYAMKKEQYDTTVSQEDQARRVKAIEDAKKGEQFEIQDRAVPPAVPYKPKVLQLLALGLLGGLGLGAGLAAVLEFLDHTVKNEDEFARWYPDLRVLGAIPNLDTDASRTRKRHRRRGIRHVAGSMALATMIPWLRIVFGGLLR